MMLVVNNLIDLVVSRLNRKINSFRKRLHKAFLKFLFGLKIKRGCFSCLDILCRPKTDMTLVIRRFKNEYCWWDFTVENWVYCLESVDGEKSIKSELELYLLGWLGGCNNKGVVKDRCYDGNCEAVKVPEVSKGDYRSGNLNYEMFKEAGASNRVLGWIDEGVDFVVDESWKFRGRRNNKNILENIGFVESLMRNLVQSKVLERTFKKPRFVFPVKLVSKPTGDPRLTVDMSWFSPNMFFS